MSKKDNKHDIVHTILFDKFFGLDFIFDEKSTVINLDFLKKNDLIKSTVVDKEKDNKNEILVNNDKKSSSKSLKLEEFNNFQDLSSVFTLEELYNILNDFNECKTLKTSLDKKTVIYDGRKNAKIMLIGEAPGDEEEKMGIPFCGQSGQLLNKVLKTIGLDRNDNLYITNTVFWRPLGNRKPTEHETNMCRPFVEKQIDIIKPNFIILCGASAVHSVLGVTESIGNLRQKIIEHITLNGTKTKCIAVYHPAFLLRNPSAKKLMWFDMLFIKNNLMK